MKFVLVIFILIISETSASRTCRPSISEGSLSKVELGEYIFIDCLIASCKDVIQVIFEKTGLTNAIEWKAVFEGFNKTNYQTLDVDNYSLKNRCSYKAFRAKHILNVKHLSIEDQGEWRCVVVDPNRKYLSNSMEVMIYVTPEERSMNISSKNDVLLVDRLEEFTCTIDGINPEPVILWKVNDTEYSEGATFNTKHTNGLWNVKNILRLRFSQTGETAINCIMEIGTNNQLLQRKVEKHIQESAKITYPVAEIDVKANAYSTFTLKCTGTAYKPHIIWTLDDEEISNNGTGYIMDQKCNTLMCESSITSKPVGGCLDMLQYTGIYTCVVTSEQPNLSTQRSPNMVVNIPIKQCKGEYDGLKLNNTIWIATFISLIALCMVMISMALVLYRSRIKEGSLETEHTKPLIAPHDANKYVAENLNEHEQETSIKTETMAKIVEFLQSPMFLEIPSDEEIVIFRQLAEEEYCSFRKLLTVMMLKFDVYENNQIGMLAAEFKTDQNEPLVDTMEDIGHVKESANGSGCDVSIETLLGSLKREADIRKLDSGIGGDDNNDRQRDDDSIDKWNNGVAMICQLVHSCKEQEILMFKQLHEEDYKSVRTILKAMILKFNVYDNNRIGSFEEELNNIEEIAGDSKIVKFMTIESYSTGTLRIQSSDYGNFIIVENTGANVEDLNGYSMTRLVDGKRILTHYFAEVPKLHIGKGIVLCPGASVPQNPYSTYTIATGITSLEKGK